MIPYKVQNMWPNAGHSLLILTSPNCSQIRVWCGDRCIYGGVGLRTTSGRLRAVPGWLRTAFSRTADTSHTRSQGFCPVRAALYRTHSTDSRTIWFLFYFLFCSTAGFVCMVCVRLSRLLVGFRSHLKSMHIHSFIHSLAHSFISGIMYYC